MTSKNFKSTVGGFSIGIHSVKDGVQFRITNMRGNYQQFTTPASVAAEQALAILEAAGYDRLQMNLNLRDAMDSLEASIEEESKRTAEAREQAELEAEALELFNAWRKTCNLLIAEDWDIVSSFRSEWLAVARKAREMRAEK